MYLVQQDTRMCFSLDPALNLMYTSIAYGTFVTLNYEVSGGVLNPAIGFAVSLVNLVGKNDNKHIYTLWLYTLMPMVGCIIASLIYKYSAFTML